MTHTLVPQEPTEEMIEAAWERYPDPYKDGRGMRLSNDHLRLAFIDGYQASLASASKPDPDAVKALVEAAKAVCAHGEWNTSEDAFDALRAALRPFMKEGE